MGFYNKFHICFTRFIHKKKHKYTQSYNELCKTSDKLNNNKFDAKMHFWQYLNNEGIDPYVVGEQTFVVGILQIINANSKMGDKFLDQNDHCLECDYKKTHLLQF